MKQIDAPISDITTENKMLDELSIKLDNLFKHYIELKEVEFVNNSISTKASIIPAKYIKTLYPFTLNIKSVYLTFLEDYNDDKFVDTEYINDLFYSYFQNINFSIAAFITQTILLDNNNLPLATTNYFKTNFLTKDNLKITNCSVTYKKYSEIVEDELIGTNTIADIFISVNDEIDVLEHDIISFNNYDKVVTIDKETSISLGELGFNNIILNSLYLTNPNIYLNNNVLYTEYIPKNNPYLKSDLILSKNISNMLTVSNAKISFIENKANQNWIAPYVKKDFNQNIVDNLYNLIVTGKENQENKEEAITYKELENSVNKILDFILDKTSGACDGK